MSRRTHELVNFVQKRFVDPGLQRLRNGLQDASDRLKRSSIDQVLRQVSRKVIASNGLVLRRTAVTLHEDAETMQLLEVVAVDLDPDALTDLRVRQLSR